MQEQTITVTLDDRPCVVPDAVASPQVARRANSYWCPLGPAAGRAWVLMLRQDLTKIQSKGKTYHELVFSTQKGGKNFGRAAFSKLLFVKSQRITPGAADADTSLHLVELADKRLLVNRFSDTGNLQMNIRSYAQATDYLTGTSGYTWSSAVQTIWNTMTDVLGSFPGLPSGYTPHGTPENLRLTGISAWRSLCRVLEKIGCAVVYNPTSDAFTIVRLGDTQTNLPKLIADGQKLLDAEPLEENAAKFPEKIRVYFHNHYQSYGQERDTCLATNWSTSGALDHIDVATKVSESVKGTVVVLWDDLPRVLDEDNSLTNSAALSARADERATNWINDHKVSGSRMHQVLPGVVSDVVPGSQVKAVLWRAWGPAAGGTATEIIRHLGLPRQIIGAETPPGRTLDGFCDFAGDNYAPPDLARHSYPSFPRLPNIIRVWDSGQSAGALTSANSDGLHPGQVRRYVAGAMATLEDCWILFVDDFDTAAGAVSAINGDYYGPGRLSGVETSGGSQKPIYLVRRGAIISSILSSIISATDCWIGNDNGTVRHRQPSSDLDFASCSTLHNIPGTTCGLYFDDAGHFVGYYNGVGSWTSPWGISEPS